MSDEHLHPEAREAVHRVTQLLAALMVEAVDQVQDDAGSARHAESTVYMQDLAREALNVPHVAPEVALFGLARSNAATIVELCHRLDTDPKVLMKAFEETYFRLTL